MTTPTPGDLSARHLAQLRDLRAFSANESYKPSLDWAIAALSAHDLTAPNRAYIAKAEAKLAALSALPAAGGEQSELRAIAHDMGAFLNANRASLPSKVIQDSYALHNRLNALAWATTPQPSAAPAAGKGVDDAMVERVAVAVFAADSGSVESWPKATQREHDFYRRIARTAVAALTRQPVAGDGMVFCQCHTERDRELCRQRKECVVAYATGRLAAPAATPTDGGEG